MMSLLQFMKRAAIWTAALSALAFVFVGIFSPIEEGMSVFGHALKTFFGWFWVTAILEAIMFSFGQLLYFWTREKKENFPGSRWWFFKGVWEDLGRIKGQITWKRIGIVIIFFAAVLVLFGGAELISRLLVK